MEKSVRSKVAWSLDSMDPKYHIISLNSYYLFVGLSAFSFVFINWEDLLVWDGDGIPFLNQCLSQDSQCGYVSHSGMNNTAKLISQVFSGV